MIEIEFKSKPLSIASRLEDLGHQNLVVVCLAEFKVELTKVLDQLLLLDVFMLALLELPKPVVFQLTILPLLQTMPALVVLMIPRPVVYWDSKMHEYEIQYLDHYFKHYHQIS